jgi:predicted secreted protein
VEEKLVAMGVPRPPAAPDKPPSRPRVFTATTVCLALLVGLVWLAWVIAGGQ